jgi:hypothetical protein
VQHALAELTRRANKIEKSRCGRSAFESGKHLFAAGYQDAGI